MLIEKIIPIDAAGMLFQEGMYDEILRLRKISMTFPSMIQPGKALLHYSQVSLFNASSIL